jgi:predicted RNA-binding Zn ribbon-like protein
MYESPRTPAPGPLGLVQAFVNSVNLESGPDLLADPDGLRAWLVERGLLKEAEPVGQDDLRRAVAVREALRALLLANNGAADEPAATEALNCAAARARLVVRFDADGAARLEPAVAGVDSALGRILAIVYTANAEGSWHRLKACREDVCRWAFYDASKNRSGAWCTMADCGNRAKARAYRQRRRAGASN